MSSPRKAKVMSCRSEESENSLSKCLDTPKPQKIIFTYINSSHIKDLMEENDLFQCDENKNGPGNTAQW